MARVFRTASRLPRLRELREARATDTLVREVARMARQINQRFYRLEKAGVGLNDTAYYYAQQATGKLKPRYSTSLNVLSKMATSDLYELALKINMQLVSETSTISGLKKVYDNRISGAQKALAERGVDVGKEDLDAFLKNGGGEFINAVKKYLSSDQIFEMWGEYQNKVSADEFIDAFYTDKQKRARTNVKTITRALNKKSRKRGG